MRVRIRWRARVALAFNFAMAFRAQALLVVWACGCSSVAPVVVVEPVAPEPLPAAKATPEEELAAAFSTGAPEKTAAPAPTAAPPVNPRKPFADAMASRSVEQACQLADTLTGLERWKAYELAFSLAANEPSKVEAALAWRHACGPEKLEQCRAAALGALGRLKSGAKLASTLKASDTCLQQAEAKGKPQPCLSLADAEHDDVNLTRSALLKAQAEPVELRRVALLERVVARCERVQCATARRKALAALTAIDLNGKHLDSAVAHALKDTAVYAATLPEAERAWARPPKVDQLCAQFDAANGAGACRKLEKQQNGSWTYRDFSVGKATGTGLSADQVKQVNEHYAPPLQACLSEQARRLVAPDQAQYEVRWVVLNDGRVGEVHLQPDLESSALAGCLRRQFVVWRYPKFEGEWQNVQQVFTVTAVTRVQVSQN